MSQQTYLAIDLGAGSGRVMAGRFDGRRLCLEEVHRFSNEGLALPGGWHWNVPQLFVEMKSGLTKAARRYGRALISVAVDGWGVDYALLDARGRLLGLPFMYRDSRTAGMIEDTATLVPLDEIYRRTGLQFMPFNTLFQLRAEMLACPRTLAAAERLLFIPDLFAFWLSGEFVVERTVASTSQFVRVGEPVWDEELAAKLGIPRALLGPITEPARSIGLLLPHLSAETGCTDLKIVSGAAHDTACAVAGVPATNPSPLFLSSGTWSLLGREIHQPLVSEATCVAGFSNEQGLGETIRFLKNVPGMWLLQECQRNWRLHGDLASYEELVVRAEAAAPSVIFDPAADEFQKPCDMPLAIRAYAEKTGQRPPVSQGEFVRAILESLAVKYRSVVDQLRRWMPDLPDTLHVVGGGSRNAMLNQLTANATGLAVIAGPAEATAAGNILSQLMAAGEIGSLQEGRSILQESFPSVIYEPAASPADRVASWP